MYKYMRVCICIQYIYINIIHSMHTYYAQIRDSHLQN